MAQPEAVTVRKEVVVDTPIERAFTVFTDRFGDFKPPDPGRTFSAGTRTSCSDRPEVTEARSDHLP